MCGRYTINKNIDELNETGRTGSPYLKLSRCNAAPSQELPIVISEHQDSIIPGIWGFLPRWAEQKSDMRPQINARSETAAQKPMFRSSFRHKRCLVLADGFYEWQQAGARKQPYRACLKDERLFSFAGLWCVAETDDDLIAKFAILTTEPNELMADIHNRMPVILRPEEERVWLDQTQDRDTLQSLLKPYPAEDMHVYPVSTKVNNPACDVPDLLVEIHN